MCINAKDIIDEYSESGLLASVKRAGRILPTNSPIVLFLRHAERPRIPDQETGNDLRLTDAGLNAARKLGFALGENIVSLNTSPILRCKETASTIRDSASCLTPIIENKELGNPGAYVYNEELAWSNWLLHGSDSVLNDLMAEDKSPPGLHSAKHGTEILLRYFQQLLCGENGYHVCVSHDVVILPFVSYLLNIPISDIPWPGFLDGAILHYENDQLVFSYQSHENVLPFKF